MAVTFKMSAENRDALRALQQTQREVEKLRAKNKSLGDATKRTTKDASKGFGALIGKVTSTTAVVGLLISSMRELSAESDLAVASIRKLADARRALNQVALSPGDLTKLDKQADQLARKFGADRQVSRDVLFAARSEGFQKFAPDIIRSNQVVAPREAARVAGSVPALFEGQISPRESVNLTLVAAQKSKLNFEQTAAVLPTAAEGAKLAGSSPEETFALLSVLAGKFAGQGTTAATRIRGLGVKFGITPGFEGGGIIGGVKKLQALPEEQRRKFLGESQELNVAFRKISESLPAIEQRIVEIEEARADVGTPRSALAKGRARAAASPQLRAARGLQRAENIEEISAERLGPATALVEQRRAEFFAKGAKTKSPLKIGFEKTLLQGMDLVGFKQLQEGFAQRELAEGEREASAPSTGGTKDAGGAPRPPDRNPGTDIVDAIRDQTKTITGAIERGNRRRPTVNAGNQNQ